MSERDISPRRASARSTSSYHGTRGTVNGGAHPQTCQRASRRPSNCVMPQAATSSRDARQEFLGSPPPTLLHQSTWGNADRSIEEIKLHSHGTSGPCALLFRVPVAVLPEVSCGYGLPTNHATSTGAGTKACPGVGGNTTPPLWPGSTFASLRDVPCPANARHHQEYCPGNMPDFAYYRE